MALMTDRKASSALHGAAAIWAGALLCLALLLYLRPYGGIRHDSILYLGQALLAWKPEQFGQDLFFAYGSQAQYTIFPQLIAWLLTRFNPPDLFLALTLLGRFFFLLASFILIRQLLPEKHHFWALPALLIMPPQYGGFMILSYGEAFLTGRTFAEPLVLLALAAFLQRRWAVALALWLLAALIHPLQALPVLLLAWFWFVRTNWRWLYLLAPLIIAVILGFSGITPFTKITAQFDPEWYEWVSGANRMVFITQWHLGDWCRLLIDLFLVWQVRESTTGRLRNLCSLLLLGTVTACALSALLADVLKMSLPAGLQIWRIQWLLHWLAVASLPFLLYELYLSGKPERLRLFLLITIASLSAMVVESVSPWAILILIALFILWPKIHKSVSPTLVRLLMVGLVLTLAFAAAKHVFFTIRNYISLNADWDQYHIDLAILSHQLLVGGLVTIGLWFWQKTEKKGHTVIVFLLAAWVVVAAWNWDRRNNWALSFEAVDFNTSVFGVELRPGAQVFWEDELLAPWLVLNRPSYFSTPQSAGFLFNRETGREAHVRQEIMQRLEFQTTLCNVMNGISKSNDTCMIDDDLVEQTCKQAEGQLDYLVLRNKLKRGILGSWHRPFLDENKRPVTYYLYQCKDFPS